MKSKTNVVSRNNMTQFIFSSASSCFSPKFELSTRKEKDFINIAYASYKVTIQGNYQRKLQDHTA